VRGQICVAPAAACVPDPCIGISCPGGQICVVLRGQPDCVDPRTLASSQAISVSLGGKGCGCQVGARAEGSPWWLLLAAVALLRRRSRIAPPARSS
jgi:MYXO-CTERM domain-containing protein